MKESIYFNEEIAVVKKPVQTCFLLFQASDRIGGDSDVPSLTSPPNSLEAPMTPCPSAVEYVTPVFAKNYQGLNFSNHFFIETVYTKPDHLTSFNLVIMNITGMYIVFTLKMYEIK